RGVDFEVRAGLSTFYDDEGRGWVADDVHSESASRTLDYAYDDHAAYVLSAHLPSRITSNTTFPNGTAVANVTEFLKIRAMNRPGKIFEWQLVWFVIYYVLLGGSS
ncbi:hypothetical protein MPER_07977, partial [Moniliophthora perniciosa FA553]